MDTARKKELLEASLHRAAEALGDITPLVLARYYARFPEAETAFATLWPGNRAGLEGEMVERTLYCLMTWLDSPGEIEIMLMGSVPHHDATLKVPPQWFGGFLETTAQVIVETIPSDAADELTVWQELRDDLGQLIAFSGGA